MSLINLNVGQLVVIETKLEILSGYIKYIDLNQKLIELDDVCDLKTNCSYNSSQLLALPQIKSIKVLQNDDNCLSSGSSGTETTSQYFEESSTSANASSSSSPLERNPHCHSRNVINSEATYLNLNGTELQQVQEQLNNVIVIKQSDNRYYKAIDDIKKQSAIGLIIENAEYGRARKTSIIAIATDQTVYIFDMIALGKVFRELKNILEAERPRKAVHYSHRLVDHLKHRQHVELNGIFDTFVAYCITTGVKQPRTLIETVRKSFNISEMYFNYSEANVHLDDPTRRPLSQSVLQFIGKCVIFQLKLYEHLLHKQMLGNFYKQCSTFSKTFSENEDITELAISMQPQSREGFQSIKQIDGDWQNFLEL